MLAAMRRASSRVNSRCANGCEDVRFPRKHKTPMPNQQHPPGIAILRDATGRLALFINGQRVNVRRGQAQLVLLACLLTNLGSAVPYKGLFTVIGRSRTTGPPGTYRANICRCSGNCCLQNNAPVVIATVHEIGYAICKIVENPRHTLRTRRSNGVSLLAKNVRHWRIAAGLTQTAVAKRSD